jgi:PAS domain S-box-containing protein
VEGDAAAQKLEMSAQPAGSPASVATALFAVGDDGAILSSDARTCALFGIPSAVLAHGKLAPVLDWLHGSGDEICVALAKLLGARAPVAESGQLASTTGRVIEWSSAPLGHGVLRGRTWAFRDTTLHHAGAHALRDAENWLRMFSAHQDGIVIEVDGSARVVGMWAAEANAFFGVSESALRGRTIADILDTSHGAELDRRIRDVLVTRTPASFELALDADASRVFAVNAVHLSTAPGEEPSVTVLIRDITQHVRLQKQLQQSERLASVGLLAAGVSHEINNPLGYMLLNLEHVRRGLAQIARDDGSAAHAVTLTELERSVAITIEGAVRVQEIVRDLTQFARTGYDETRLIVDIDRVLASTLELVSAELELRARVVRELAPVPPIRASERRLAQLFLNLVLNAAQAIPAGDPEGNEIRVVTKTDDLGRATIEVHDTGIGIPDDVVGHIFDPFFTTKAPGGGTGLGLAICHGITTAFGGSIVVESRKGVGSTFRVVFPTTEVVADTPPSEVIEEVV